MAGLKKSNRRKGFTPPKKGKTEVAYETISRPFQHLRTKKKEIETRVSRALS
jgi:hypothetical protein